MQTKDQIAARKEQTRADIEEIKAKAEMLQSGAEKIHEFSENARKLIEAGEKVNAAQDLMAKYRKFGSVAKGFMLANIGLEIALMFMGDAPDKDDLILKAIEALDNKVTGLWASMNSQVNQIKEEIALGTAMMRVMDELEFFAALGVTMANLRSSDENIRANAERDMLDDDNTPNMIKKRFLALAAAVVDPEHGNPFQAAYKQTNGAPSKIVKMSDTFMAYVLLAPTAYTVSAALHHLKDPTSALATPLSVANEFDAVSDRMIEHIERWLKRCETELSANVTATIKDYVTTDFYAALPGTDRSDPTYPECPWPASANSLVQHLEGKYPETAFWVVIGVKAITRKQVWDIDDFSGNGMNYTAFDGDDQDGKKYSLAVFWDPHKSTRIGYSATQASLADIIQKDKPNYLYNKMDAPYSNYDGGTLKQVLYEHGAQDVLNELAKAQYQPVLRLRGAVVHQKDYAWACATNVPERMGIWAYPSWSPAADASIDPNRGIKPDRLKEMHSAMVAETGGSGNEGIVAMFIA
ncbi:MAG: hypothetical protein ACJAWC_003337 [Yoonia sp.]|jgi:hypothetical protein